MSRETYLKAKAAIKADKNLSEAQKQERLFNLWIDYVHSSISKKAKSNLKFVAQIHNIDV
jgi:hypothetical protein